MHHTLLWIALGLYGLAFATAALAPRLGRWPLLAGLGAHTAAMASRGWAIGFFPLTGKLESFSTAALALAVVALATWRPDRRYLLPLCGLLVLALAVAFRFPADLRYPPPLMWTVWYPLHVPLAFGAYALWAAAAVAALPWLGGRDPAWIAAMDRYALWGFGLWSLSMICGGVWGVLAWGAYFLWDPKVIWSVILWFHYATYLHVRLTPTLAPRTWVRPLLALLGFFFVLVAYVGTSFFFGRSSHAF